MLQIMANRYNAQPVSQFAMLAAYPVSQFATIFRELVHA
jgi:hypothetical protein